MFTRLAWKYAMLSRHFKTSEKSQSLSVSSRAQDSSFQAAFHHWLPLRTIEKIELNWVLWCVLCQVNSLMVVGIDTYHDTLRRGRSVAGFVASLNNTCTRYYTRWAFQQTGEELHNSLQMFMTSTACWFFSHSSVLCRLLRTPLGSYSAPQGS